MNKINEPLKYKLYRAIHRWLGNSNFMSRIAVSLHFHTRKIFKYHLMDNSGINSNGEFLLIETAASQVNCFIDVGANKGEWTEILLNQGHLIKIGLLYEPNENVFKQLQQKFSSYENLILIDKAVGEIVTNQVFYESSKTANLSSLVIYQTLPEMKERIIEVTTLDAEVEKYKLESIDLLKIDVEGFDLQVLKGAKNLFAQKKIGIVQFEYSRGWADAGSTLKYAIKFLQSFGYQVFLLKNQGLYDFQYEWYGEYFEYSNFVAISPKFKWVQEKLYRGKI